MMFFSLTRHGRESQAMVILLLALAWFVAGARRSDAQQVVHLASSVHLIRLVRP